MKSMMSKIVDGEIVIVFEDAPEVTFEANARRALSPRQFIWMLAYSGLEETWDALEAHTKDTDPFVYANLKAQRAARSFEYDLTMSFVADLRPLAEQITPDVDLSEEAITAAWDLAAEQTFGSLT